ncbi:unnamed protein product [Lepeophtheirus salmonis]|uniref:(salmon louse) hypothetical protein n=1 Tax=Lepeophtheirus salmonis TaxID=72036 RepID=A0A7R8CRI8_LEPSM|nr:unnamed protein product [Lepeophtheirus salmonis]CAF2905804.1 unnamed protein product [Lepeophtheirus salmonis]
MRSKPNILHSKLGASAPSEREVLYMEEGQGAILPCFSSGSPPPFTRIQELDERVCSEMEQFPKFYAEFNTDGNQDLYIQQLQEIRELQKKHGNIIKASGNIRSVMSKLVHSFVGLNQDKNYVNDLHHFHDEVITIQRALKAKDTDLEELNVSRFVIPLLESKVSGLLRDRWERFVSEIQDHDLFSIEKFLLNVQILAKVAKLCPNNCMEQDSLDGCMLFKRETYNARQLQVKNLDVCFNCLKMGHRLNECLSINLSQKCNGRHHTLHHRTENETELVPSISKSNIAHISTIIARTYIVSNDRSEEVCVLFNPRSQVSLATLSVG